ncbi:MAG: tetratricopeptide repeat protein [Chloroflexi bacterium]|nr:tetratricopeptide repeat protein [Chloroflexota bacterium]
MVFLSGRRPLWLLLISLLIFSATLAGRLTLGQAPLSAAREIDEPVSARPAWTTVDRIVSMQDRLRLDPEDTAAYAQLGLALLQQVRETGDASLYTQAEQAFTEALKRDPRQFDALMGQGSLALSRHQFRDALEWGKQALALNPHRGQVYGIIGDAQVELGQYEAAAKTIQKMIETRPELASYSRMSYQRELHGDTAAAIAAMQMAVDSGLPTAEGTLWAQTQLGHLYFNSGNLTQVEQTYQQALQFRPDYIYAQAGLARVRAAQGQSDEAIALYQKIVERLPLPEFVIALGEVYEVAGQPAKAKQQYDLVRAIQQLNASAGMNVDMELALFNTDHGANPAQALQQARAAYVERPSIYGADTLAWALYHAGQYVEAQQYSQEALRLGTRDAMLYYHAGMIAYAVKDMAAAREYLHEALAINPNFSIRYGPQARALLAELSPR